MPAFNREQIRAALALDDPTKSSYLDLQTGDVVQISETEASPENEQLRDEVMAAYGDRFRYISGGNASADDAAVAAWIEGEGL